MTRAPTPPSNFDLHGQGQLSENNRWVIMAKIIPWSEFEDEYAENFTVSTGAPAKSFRMALGALIIKERLGTSDKETLEQIRENPYLQYFIGMTTYSDAAPFDSSMFVHFRERIGVNLVNKINEKMVKEQTEVPGVIVEKKPSEISEPKNQGKLILDATCTPADIKYPTDLGLLNQAREHTEKIIDALHNQIKSPGKKKPRTYRNRARKEYLTIAKKRKPRQKERRKVIKKQLQYIQRNLANIERMGALQLLTKSHYKMLLVVAEVYRQQLSMYENKEHTIPDRIVCLKQPHIRPIVRGKAGKSVEFGAKLSASCRNGYVFLDRISWDNFNESGDLKRQVEAFKQFTGFYPESIHVDRIYRTEENRAWCKELGIRMSGVRLGRPPKNLSKTMKKQAQSDERIRNLIEGKFGEAKRRFSLGRVMAKLDNTSETSIAITFLVMNLSALLRQAFWLFFGLFHNKNLFSCFLASIIGKSYVSPEHN
ncbi:IS5 family transposase [Microcoleus sp. OTE_8_concoct_300]|uniref:IS5 family transposase n=1 Tax=Microcoleus sp. OTE_8_concoct_300 TaxID=2964710 RepID=UPI00403FAFE7